MIANIKGALLLSTSNRSEAAVGYATMDGDTSGGLSPIAGIDKAFLREWLCWLEDSGLAGLGPFSFLGPVNSQQPTAELRPSAEGQTDEADLMPYPILNRIEALAIRDLHSPSGCLQILKEENQDIEPVQLRAYVIRFFQLWSRNQWKRERYAPSFHLDDRNLDPRTWCRFPILNSGFAQELNELKV
jgi:NAD+ synthase (glutamine-hydrolysing)